MALLLIVILLVLNGVCSMAETALVSSHRIRLKQRADRGWRGARAALALTASPLRFLSTIQVGNTLTAILIGAVGETALASALEERLARFDPAAPYANQAATIVVVLGLTLLTVILGELAPKRIALVAPEAVASALAPAVELAARIIAPLVAFMSWIVDSLLHPITSRTRGAGAPTSAEINIMVEEGARAGEFHPEEKRLIERVLHLGDQRISSLMVHRTDMLWFDASTPIAEARKTARRSALSYFPVCKGRVDRIIGVVGLRELLPADGATDLKSLTKPPIFVPESAPVLRVLDQCRHAGAPVAFVVDEYGDVQGEITVERILDSLVGRVFSAARPRTP